MQELKPETMATLNGGHRNGWNLACSIGIGLSFSSGILALVFAPATVAICACTIIDC